jgi:hypothetical protein
MPQASKRVKKLRMKIVFTLPEESLPDDEVDDAPGRDKDEKAENESRLYLAGGVESLPNDEVDDAPGKD